MSRSRYKIYEEVYPYFMTSSFVENLPLFADPNAAQIVLNSLTFLQNQREVTLYTYVLMENHFHVIAKGEDLAKKMMNLKSYTAREIIDNFKQKKEHGFLSSWCMQSYRIKEKAHTR